jgi:hypothetical protein
VALNQHPGIKDHSNLPLKRVSNFKSTSQRTRCNSLLFPLFSSGPPCQILYTTSSVHIVLQIWAHLAHVSIQEAFQFHVSAKATRTTKSARVRVGSHKCSTLSVYLAVVFQFIFFPQSTGVIQENPNLHYYLLGGFASPTAS